jgi:hypothetical protein
MVTPKTGLVGAVPFGSRNQAVAPAEKGTAARRKSNRGGIGPTKNAKYSHIMIENAKYSHIIPEHPQKSELIS